MSNDAFDQWFFRAIDPTVMIEGRSVPVGTTLFFRVCKGDQALFEEAVRLMRVAFEGRDTCADAELIDRDEIARVLEIVARDGLPGPRDLDGAIDAILAACFQGKVPV